MGMHLSGKAFHKWHFLGGSEFISSLVQVVAADLKSEAGRDFVTYKVRVADDAAEWTVSRRFRNFEALHSRLRQVGTQVLIPSPSFSAISRA